MRAAPLPDIAIIDPCCATGYTPETLGHGALGGTEATVLRVTMALDAHARTVHFQQGRDQSEITVAGWMKPLAHAFCPGAASTFIVINSWKVACKLRKSHPVARILLWLHIHPGRHNRPMAVALAAADIGVICVSQSHARQLRKFLGPDANLRIDYIHNPIADDLAPDATSRDRSRLLFASSPHKGLAQVFTQFRAARAVFPDLTLAVADPGYLAWDTGLVPDGVVLLGTLPHHVLTAEMRRAFRLFYPQTTFAETFGLVLVEANAVGLPVLVHRDIGANAEVVGDPAQLVDGNDTGAIITRLEQWRTAPLVVCANPAFRLTEVAHRWVAALGLDSSAATLGRKVA